MRSAVMSPIRGRGNKDTELRLIALMREHRITGWRRNAPVFGKPDFVFRPAKLAVLWTVASGTAARATRRRPRTTAPFGKPSSHATRNATGR